MGDFTFFNPNHRYLFSHQKEIVYVDEPNKADFYLLPGGADISPFLYGEPVDGAVGIDHRRDAEEIALIGEARSYGIPIVGICRGAQLLHAMNGGKLIQDITGHRGGAHGMLNHNLEEVARVNSIHHQAIPPDEAIRMYGSENVFVSEDMKAVEAFFDWDRMVFGVQYHPEFTGCPKEGINFFLESLEEILGGT